MRLTGEYSNIILASSRYADKTFTGISSDSLKWWASYAQRMIFKTPEEARAWVFRRMERSDQEPYAGAFGINGPEYNKKFSEAIPLYQSGKSWKIGKRVRKDTRFKLSDLQVKTPDIEYLNEVANSNTEQDWEFGGIKWLRISDLIGDAKGDSYYSLGTSGEYIKSLAYRIKENGWIEAVVVGQTGLEYELWEGQHRTRALRVLGFSTVPAYIIKVDEE
jgi:hypothetical protein